MRFLAFSQFFSLTSMRFFTVACLISILSSCSSVDSPKKTKQITQQIQPKQVEKTDQRSSKTLLKQIKKAGLQEANKLLIQLSKRYLTEEKPAKALWLSNQLLQKTQSKENQFKLLVTACQAYIQRSDWADAKTYLEAAKKLAEAHKLIKTLDYYTASYAIANNAQQNTPAFIALLHIFTLNDERDDNNEVLNNIWHTISYLSSWQINQLSKKEAPYLQGWLALINVANKYGGSEFFQQHIEAWQRDYSVHPAQFILPELLQQSADVTLNSIKKVTVILPLTGKQAKAGITAQQGILAAYNEINQLELSFIDSATTDFAMLEEQLSENETDMVIGPLLKSNVEQYIQVVNNDIPVLFLNIPQTNTLKAHQISLSMRPEDEAIQAASTLSQQNFSNPIVLFHNDSISNRIAHAFQKQWYKLTDVSPTTLPFEQGREMQKELKKILAVDESKKRIDQLNRLIRENIETEKRSRRDIDMFYLVGNTQQIRLLKPYIDVNTSPFADIIPVFASSRSHSLIQDNSTNNDLKDLTFTQMPWLLDSKQQNKTLAATSQQIWPTRSSSLQRIFAMGYDSIMLLPKLTKMQQAPYIRHYGQTGILRLNANNIITRSLLWGKYSKNKVTEIVME